MTGQLSAPPAAGPAAPRLRRQLWRVQQGTQDPGGPVRVGGLASDRRQVVEGLSYAQHGVGEVVERELRLEPSGRGVLGKLVLDEGEQPGRHAVMPLCAWRPRRGLR